jgi:hypothetical protein
VGIVADVRSSLRHGPRAVVRAHLAQGPQEARAFAFLMIGCGLVFVAQWPRLARASHETGAEFARLAAYEMLAWMTMWPLLFFLLALIAHGTSRALGGQGTAWGARLALFWSWLAAAPFALGAGIVAGFAGPGPAANLAGVVWLGAFAVLWSLSQREAADGPRRRVA